MICRNYDERSVFCAYRENISHREQQLVTSVAAADVNTDHSYQCIKMKSVSRLVPRRGRTQMCLKSGHLV